ncbi:MAG: hypothetical protein V3U35_02435 [Candidatus Neomarinimicrobiota bacterium]
MPVRASLITRLLIGLVAAVAALEAGDTPLDLDVGLFRTTDGHTRLEVYVGIRWMEAATEGGAAASRSPISGVVMLKQRGQLIAFEELVVENPADAAEPGVGGVIPRQVSFAPSPGSYQVQAVVEVPGKPRAEKTVEVEIAPFEGGHLALSSVLLAHRIRRGAGGTGFGRQGVAPWPNAGSGYGDGEPLLWYYAEVYGLAPLDEVAAWTSIWQGQNEVISPGPKRTATSGLVFPHWGALNLAGLGAGDYRLGVTVAVNGDTVSQSKAFYVVRDTIVADTSHGLAPPDRGELLDMARALSSYAPVGARVRYASLSEDDLLGRVGAAAASLGREQGKDSTASLDDLLHNWRNVEAYERGLRRERGRLTAQGRVMLAHGPPDRVDTYPATTLHREHHVWWYPGTDSAGQAVFVGLRQTAALELIHATLPGLEPSTDWSRELPWIPPPAEADSLPAPDVAATEEAEPASGPAEADGESAPVDAEPAEEPEPRPDAPQEAATPEEGEPAGGPEEADGESVSVDAEPAEEPKTPAETAPEATPEPVAQPADTLVAAPPDSIPSDTLSTP